MQFNSSQGQWQGPHTHLRIFNTKVAQKGLQEQDQIIRQSRSEEKNWKLGSWKPGCWLAGEHCNESRIAIELINF